MSEENKTKFKAALIKTRIGDVYTWYWANVYSNSPISPEFFSQKEAEKWFDDIKLIHEETYDLIKRCKYGEFQTVKGRIDLEEFFVSSKLDSCPFTMYFEDDILEIIVLALDKDDAKQRVRKYINHIDWVD